MTYMYIYTRHTIKRKMCIIYRRQAIEAVDEAREIAERLGDKRWSARGS